MIGLASVPKAPFSEDPGLDHARDEQGDGIRCGFDHAKGLVRTLVSVLCTLATTSTALLIGKPEGRRWHATQ